jgi:hypothetical protein
MMQQQQQQGQQQQQQQQGKQQRQHTRSLSQPAVSTADIWQQSMGMGTGTVMGTGMDTGVGIDMDMGMEQLHARAHVLLKESHALELKQQEVQYIDRQALLCECEACESAGAGALARTYTVHTCIY